MSNVNDKVDISPDHVNGEWVDRQIKCVIAGGRDFWDWDLLVETLERVRHELGDWDITEIVSGTARGADTLGAKYAVDNDIPVKEFPANWDKHGRSAGYLRNEEMAEYADMVICFWDGQSRGTRHMIDLAKMHKCRLVVVKYEGEKIQVL